MEGAEPPGYQARVESLFHQNRSSDGLSAPILPFFSISYINNSQKWIHTSAVSNQKLEQCFRRPFLSAYRLTTVSVSLNVKRSKTITGQTNSLGRRCINVQLMCRVLPLSRFSTGLLDGDARSSPRSAVKQGGTLQSGPVLPSRGVEVRQAGHLALQGGRAVLH